MIFTLSILSHNTLHHCLLQISASIIQDRLFYVSKVLTTTILLIALSCNSYSQKENNNWLIDGDNWIDFNSGAPVVREPLEFYAQEASASVSDSSGNLLFYTNGYALYNRLGEVFSTMEYSHSDSNGIQTITNGILILPEIQSPNQYRIISLGQYAIVDMTLNGGLGGMLETPSRKFFDSDFPHENLGYSEKNHAVRHANGRDWWIVQLRLFSDHENEVTDSVVVSYLYDPTGIHKVNEQRVNLYSNPGVVSSYGEMTFSKSGDRIAIISGNSVVAYNFNRCTGSLVSEIAHIDTLKYLYGGAFSSSGRFLYFTKSTGVAFYEQNILYQLDLEKDQFGKNKLTEIFRRNNARDYANGQLELGPDDKIYMTIGCVLVGLCSASILTTNLSVINLPDLPELSCDFDTLSINLGSNSKGIALPNTVNYSLGALEGSECDTLNNTTAIQSIETLAIQWQVFPTLSSGRFTFSGPANALFSVSDVWGRSVPYERLSDNEFDLGALPAGIYLIQASHHNEQQTFKVVKQ